MHANIMRHPLGALAAAILIVLIPGMAEAGEAPDLSGRELYATFCASCHGEDARGGRTARMTKLDAPDLASISKRYGGTFPAEEIRSIVDGTRVFAAHCSRAMPAWGSEFYAYDGEDPARRKRANLLIGRLVEYLRSIQTVDR